jgi:hypothetical protein
VLNIARNPIRSEMPPPLVEDPTLSGLERLLRVSSARGASTLYLSSNSRPCVRVDGELEMLDGEPVLVPRDVESLLLTLMPERSHEALRTGAATEWICDLEGVGRVRCMSFRDQRGPGGVFRLMPTRSVSADQIGLPQAVQALAIEPEGLVLIAGPRSSGKRTTLSAFVDLMNRTRRDHIITIEREINIQHERGNSFISQREVRGSDEDLLVAARAAMREDPDVLVIEELRWKRRRRGGWWSAASPRTPPPAPSTASSTFTPPSTTVRCRWRSPTRCAASLHRSCSGKSAAAGSPRGKCCSTRPRCRVRLRKARPRSCRWPSKAGGATA